MLEPLIASQWLSIFYRSQDERTFDKMAGVAHHEEMAGGMSSRRPAEQRLQVLLARAGKPLEATDHRPRCEARHCWVMDPPGWPGRWPGLLHRWYRSDDGWRGEVTMAVVHEGQQIVVHAQVPAAMLRPL